MRSRWPPTQSIGELVNAINAGQVDLLLILESNPVYDAPADIKFAAALQKVSLRVHLGLHENEKFFTFHAGARDKTVAANPELGRSDFQVVEREDRSVLGRPSGVHHGTLATTAGFGAPDCRVALPGAHP